MLYCAQRDFFNYSLSVMALSLPPMKITVFITNKTGKLLIFVFMIITKLPFQQFSNLKFVFVVTVLL